MRGIEKPFGDAFVEVSAPRKGMNAVPFLAPGFFDGYEMAPGGICSAPSVRPKQGYNFQPWVDFSAIWFGNAHGPNYFSLLGAGPSEPLKDGATVCLVCQNQRPMPSVWGNTFYSPKMMTIDFVGGIEDYCTNSTKTETALQGTTSHEVGHQFIVNASSSSGHDDRCQWTATGTPDCSVTPTTCTLADDGCLMNPGRERWNLNHVFDHFDLFCGSPGCPSGNTPGCCLSCDLKGNGSIRQFIDPIPGG